MSLGDCIHNTSGKLVWTCCRSNNCRNLISGIFHIFFVYASSNCSMCINHIITCLIYFADSFLRLFFGAVVSIEILQLGFHLRCNSVFTTLGKIFHKFCTLLRISACNAIDQALQIAGNQDIHRW